MRKLQEALYEIGRFLTVHALFILIVPLGIAVSAILRALHTEGEDL